MSTPASPPSGPFSDPAQHAGRSDDPHGNAVQAGHPHRPAGEGVAPVDWARVRGDFPILSREVHGKPLVYLDNANTSQKPEAVVAAVDGFYRRHNANVSRAVHALGAEATDAYEGARKRLARFLNVRHDELVLCSGTTFAINRWRIRGRCRG